MQVKKKILIVDDQAMMVELWALKFSQMDFEVDLARDGLEAISKMKNAKFDAILLDLYLPKKNGFDVLAEKADTLNEFTPIYVMTSSVKSEDVTRVLELGAKKAFLKFQTSPKEVAAVVQNEIK